MKPRAMRAPASEIKQRRPTSRDAAAAAAVDEELCELERLGLDALRGRWRNRWGRRAPTHLSASLIYRVMAYRIQAEAFVCWRGRHVIETEP